MHTWLTNKRRLSDDILVAFHHACDQGDIEVAQSLLRVLEFMIRRPTAAPARSGRGGGPSVLRRQIITS
jgi:hypothetical protein